jgi:hypothetical protein
LTHQLFGESSRRFLITAALVLVIGAATTATAQAQTQTVYNSIPKPLPGNVASEGPEAYAFSELGDGFNLAGVLGGTLGQVTVVLSSWGCQTGHWYSGDCVTTAGATFNQPITINVYSVAAGLAPGTLLATITQTFNILYRPSSTPALCGGDASRWYNSKDKTCYHGLAAPVAVNFSNSHLSLPKQIIVTVAFNSTHYGFSPIGESAPCFTSSGGCPYDSLNISTDTAGGIFAGSPLDLDGIFVNYTLSNNSCTGAATTGVLALDTAPGCWIGYHPEIQVVANQNSTPHKKGLTP